MKQGIILYRERLHAMLQKGLTNPLIMLVAGPGYGKTRLLKHFISRSGRKIIWLDLKPVHNDTTEFWKLLKKQLADSFPTLEEYLSEQGIPITWKESERFLKVFAEGMKQSDGTVLVLDHFQQLQSAEMRIIILWLIERQIEDVCIIIATSAVEDLQTIGNLQVEQTVLLADELQFSSEEMQEYWQQCGIMLEEQEMDLVLRWTEGWPAAIAGYCQEYLAQGDHPDHSKVLRGYFGELFQRDYYEAYPEYFRQLLVEMSTIPVFSMEIISSLTALNQEQIRCCLRHHHFIRYNHARQTFRFHAMYKEFLEQKTLILEPERVGNIWRTASDWYQQNDMMQDAAGVRLNLNHARFAVAAPYLEQGYGFYGMGDEELFAAEAAHAVGAIRLTNEQSHKAIYKAMARSRHDIVVAACFVLVRSHFYAGELYRTEKALAYVKDYVKLNWTEARAEAVEYFYSWYYLMMGDPDRVTKWGSHHDIKQYQRTLVHSMFNRMVYAGYLMAKKRYAIALVFILQMELPVEQKEFWMMRLYLHLMKAKCYVMENETRKAADSFGMAYRMAYPNDIIMPFVNDLVLLEKIADYAEHSEWYELDPVWIKRVMQKAQVYSEHLKHMHKEYKRRRPTSNRSGIKLTDREKEVLCYLSQGLNRREIGAQMGITESGVKSHITNIYNKLGALNRADAIRLAIQQGDLPLN